MWDVDMDGRGWFIDRYEVLRTVSEGPRATVLQALDHVHDRFVALKVYSLLGEDRDNLLAEGRVLMSMRPHPALPVVRNDFFTSDGDKYVLVINWIEGDDLQTVLDDEGNPGLRLEDVIKDLSSVADALDHLHSHNPPIVHGDVKPANLIRSDDGHVVLVDFDIAIGSAMQGTAGTSGFIAPEVCGGDKPSPAADIYGLAATVVTLLSGRPPRSATQLKDVAPAEQQVELTRILENALATDPARRPRSARKLVESLRRLPDVRKTGVVAMLAVEIADAARPRREHDAEVQDAVRRARDDRDTVIAARGGQLVAELDLGDSWVAMFPEPSSAALAALELRQRARWAPPSRGVELRPRAAIVVGEAISVDDHATGPLIDQVVRLRSLAERGTTITSVAAAALLVDLVGHGISLVPFVDPATSDRLFVLGGPDEATLPSIAVPDEPVTFAPLTVSRAGALGKAVSNTTTLTFITFAAVGVIFHVVLSSVLELEWPGPIVAFVGVVGALVSFFSCYSRDLCAQDEVRCAQLEREEHDRKVREEAAERLRLRQRLLEGLDRLRSDEASEGAQALRGLALEFESIKALVERWTDRPPGILESLLPSLAEDAYRNGVSALSDALELFEETEGPAHERIVNQLAEIDERLGRNTYVDIRARHRDEQRRDSNLRLLARHNESRQRGCDLVFEAERCTAALTEARIELASAHAGDTEVDVDAVVRSLEQTIQRVREVQDELRRLGHEERPSQEEREHEGDDEEDDGEGEGE